MTSAIITGLLTVLWILGWIFTVRAVDIPSGPMGMVAVIWLLVAWPVIAARQATSRH